MQERFGKNGYKKTAAVPRKTKEKIYVKPCCPAPVQKRSHTVFIKEATHRNGQQRR